MLLRTVRWGMKATKEQAQYRKFPRGGSKCADCTMFKAYPTDHCTAVKGLIDPKGWCKYFTKRK